MIDTYFPILVLIVFSALFVVTMLVLSIVIGPRKYSEVKDEPFECGTIASGDVSGRHSVKFYLLAVTFIVFDVEIVFLYPWAVTAKQLGWYGLAAVSPFLFILALGLIFEWRRGVLDLN